MLLFMLNSRKVLRNKSHLHYILGDLQALLDHRNGVNFQSFSKVTDILCRRPIVKAVAGDCESI